MVVYSSLAVAIDAAAFRAQAVSFTVKERAIGVPLTIAVACGTVLDLAIETTAKGNRNALVDAGTGVFLVRAALRASVFTARSTLNHASDQSFIGEVGQRITQVESRADDAYEQVVNHIEAQS